jgi:hypothetical protein
MPEDELPVVVGLGVVDPDLVKRFGWLTTLVRDGQWATLGAVSVGDLADLFSRGVVITLHHPPFDHPDVVPHAAPDGIEPAGHRRATFTDAAQGVLDVLNGTRPAAVANPGWEK